MNYQIEKFNQVDARQWNQWLAQLSGATYLQSFDWLHFLSLYENVQNDSFCLMNEDGAPLAICPLIMTVKPEISGKKAVIGGDYLGAPALADSPSRFRKLRTKSFGGGVT